MDGNVPSIEVIDGIRQQMDSETGHVSRLYFARYAIEIKGIDNAPGTRWREANERTFIELLNPDISDTRDVSSSNLFATEAQIRLLSPLNTLAFALTALCFVLLGPFNRRGHSRKIFAAAIAVALLQALFLAVSSAAKKEPAFLFILYITTLAPIASGFFLLHYRGEAWLTATLRFVRQFGKKAKAAT